MCVSKNIQTARTFVSYRWCQINFVNLHQQAYLLKLNGANFSNIIFTRNKSTYDQGTPSKTVLQPASALPVAHTPVEA